MSFEAFHVTAPELTTEDRLVPGFSEHGTHPGGDVLSDGDYPTSDE